MQFFSLIFYHKLLWWKKIESSGYRMDLSTFQLMARYNIWATKRLIQALENVTDEDFSKDCGLFFKSILGTLNHLLIGEHYLWFARFSEGNSPVIALNTMIESNRNTLTKALEERAENWIFFLENLDVACIERNLDYTTSTGKDMSLPYWATLLHVFNHATHHRGQITAALTAMGYDCPELDLVYMLVEEKSRAP